MKTFIDNVTIQVIESTVLEDLVHIFTPLSVVQMKEGLVKNIASESQENQKQREILKRKFDILTKGMEICKRHAAYRSAGEALSNKERGLHWLTARRS
jgi:hypothetical protein